MNAVLVDGWNWAEPGVWHDVVPRRIACLHVPCKSVHVGVKTLLIHSGCAHPQALAYAVTVAGASHHRVCSGVAADLLKAMRYHPERLVNQAELMVRELGRVDFSPARPVARGTGNRHRLCVDEQSRECTLNNMVEPVHTSSTADAGHYPPMSCRSTGQMPAPCKYNQKLGTWGAPCHLA